MNHTHRHMIPTRENALAPSPRGRGRGVKVSTPPAPTQWRRRGFAAWRILLKLLTLTLSFWERCKRAHIKITLTRYRRRCGGDVYEPRLPGDNVIEQLAAHTYRN